MMRLGGSLRAIFVTAIVLASTEARAFDTEVSAPRGLPSDSPGPATVEIALFGMLEQDPPLFERIRSLFPNETAVVLRSPAELDAGAVLRPKRADTLYLWISLSSRDRARVYLAARDGSGGAVRHLYRDVVLEAGLDEVGSETLAQIAHSAAEALWRREEHTPESQVVQALESEPPAAPRASPGSASRASEPPLASRASLASASRDAKPAPGLRESPASPTRETKPPPRPESPVAPLANPGGRDAGVVAPSSARRAAAFRLGFGASFAGHASGAEGWLLEPGVFLSTEYRDRFSLRLAGLYLVPTEFDVLPARVRLSGASAELRAGWLPWRSPRARVRLDAGFGLFFARWSASIAKADPPARASSARAFVRPSTLVGTSFEWALGPAWVAARAELRVLLRKTRYEIERSEVTASSGSVNPGGALELGIAFD